MNFLVISLRWRPNIFVNLQSHTTTWQSGCSRTVISPCSWQPRIAIFLLFWQYFCQKSCSAWENCRHDKYKISPLVHSFKSDDETTNCYQCKNSTYFSSKSCTWRVDKTFCRLRTYWRRSLNYSVKSCNKKYLEIFVILPPEPIVRVSSFLSSQLVVKTTREWARVRSVSCKEYPCDSRKGQLFIYSGNALNNSQWPNGQPSEFERNDRASF